MRVFSGQFTYESEFLSFILNPAEGAATSEVRAGLMRMKAEIDQRLKDFPTDKKDISGGTILVITADIFKLYQVQLSCMVPLDEKYRYYAVFARKDAQPETAIVERFEGDTFECLPFNKEGLNFTAGDRVDFIELPLRRLKT